MSFETEWQKEQNECCREDKPANNVEFVVLMNDGLRHVPATSNSGRKVHLPSLALLEFEDQSKRHENHKGDNRKTAVGPITPGGMGYKCLSDK